MNKRLVSIVSTLGLIAGLFVIPAAAQAQEVSEIPAVVQIEDPYGDANTQSGDQVTPADGGSQTDIGKVWFSHDAQNLNVHFLTEGAPGANSFGFQFNVTAGEAGCLVFDGFYDGTTYTSENLGRATDNCNKLPTHTEGTSFTFGPGPGGQGGLATITVPRSYSPLFADGSAIVKPAASTWIFAGGQQVFDATKTYRGVRQRIDDTKVGTDYTISGGDPVTEPEPEPKPTVAPPGKNDPPGKGKKNGCDNGNGKKKGACPGGKPGKPKPPVAPACPPYVPGEEGKDAKTTVVTDAATAEKPVVVELDTAAGLGNDAGLGEFATGNSVYDETTSIFQNIQLDTKAADAGLYVKLEFPEVRDYDLYVNRADGSEADHSGDFNTAANTAFSCGGTSCESSTTSEAVLGLRTADCAGWTAKIVSFLSEGGPVTLSLWVGDVLAEPAPPPEPESRTAMDMLFATLGL